VQPKAERRAREEDPGPPLADVESVRQLVDFLLSCLEPRTRAVVQALMREQQLGFRPKTGAIGGILPQPVDFFGVVENDDPSQ